MKHVRRYKILVFLAAIFAAGVVTGRMSSKEEKVPPTVEQMTKWRLERLSKGVGLTQEQVDQIRPIADVYSEALQEINHTTIETINAIIEQENREIAPILTEEQKAVHSNMEKERLDSLNKKCHKKVTTGKDCTVYEKAQAVVLREKEKSGSEEVQEATDE